MLPLGNELMNELYFLNYNFWDIFAALKASAPLENCDVDKNFCPFIFLYSFFFNFFFFNWSNGRVKFLLFKFFPPAVFPTAWLRVFSGLRGFCSCSVHVGRSLGQWKWPWVVMGQCLPCAAPVQLIQINLVSCPAVKAWQSWQSWNHQDPTEIALN